MSTCSSRCSSFPAPRPWTFVWRAAWIGVAILLASAGCGRPDPKPEKSDRTVESAYDPRTTGPAADPDLGPPDSAAVPRLVRRREGIDAEMSEEESEEENDKKPDHPDGLAQERYRDRAGENGVVPPNALVHAKQALDRVPTLTVSSSLANKDGGIWNWEWLGPGNVGGRVRTALVHPTIAGRMWIGGVAGGIWKSTNGGQSWVPVDDFMASLAVSSLTLDPTNPSVMYAATGEGFFNHDALPGAGIFKSTDGGNTWAQLPSTASWGTVNRLSHDPDQPNTVFAARSFPSGIYRSADGGASWAQVLSIVGSIAVDVKVNPWVGDLVMAASRGSNAGVWLSMDGGDTWQEQTVGGAGMLPASTGRCEVAWGTFGSIAMVSMDRNGGEVWKEVFFSGPHGWELVNSGTNYLGTSGWYANTIWTSPQNAFHFVVGGLDLWRSTDGQTLQRISDWRDYHTGSSAHADQHFIVASPGFDGVNDKTVFFCNDGGIQKTNDVYALSQNSGWINLANGLGITQFYGGAAAPDGSILVGGTQDNDQLRYRPADGTEGWYQAKTGDGGYAAVDFDDPSVVYGEYVNLRIDKSTNGGASYVNAITGLLDAGNNARFIAPFSMDPNDPHILVGGGASIWRTTNQAGNWSSIRPPVSGGAFCSAIDIAVGNSQRIWVGYENGTVSRTLATVGDWVDVDIPTMPNTVVTDIAINPANANEVFVTFGGYVTNSVWFTADAGATWELRTGAAPTALPAIQVNTIRFHPGDPDWVYVGTDLGVLASEDKGLTWNRTPRYGLVGHDGPVNTEVSELFWQGGQYLLAATHGRGVYRARPLVVVYVDASASGFIENGTFLFPYDTFQEGYDAAGNGTTINLQAGTYQVPATLSKRVRVVASGGSVHLQ
jgi:hypothetical protein